MLKDVKPYFIACVLLSSGLITASLNAATNTNVRNNNTNIHKNGINKNIKSIKKLKNENNNLTFKSKLLQELEVVLNRIAEQDKKRQLEMQKEMEKMRLEREKLQKTKQELEKERMLKGVITKDDVQRERNKINEKKQMLMAKMQYIQAEQQFKSNDINTYYKVIKSRINYFKKLKNELKKEFIITKEHFDFIKINDKNVAYVKSTVLSSLLKRIDVENKNSSLLDMKIASLTSGLKLETINDLRQLLSVNNINSYRPEKYNSNTMNLRDANYIKLEKGQVLGENIYVKEITPSYIIIARKE